METIAWMEKHLVEAEHLFFEGRVDEGLTALNGLLYDEPGYGNLHNYLGWAYMYYGNDVKLAEMHLKMAIYFEPAYAPPYLHLGNLLSRAGRYTEALQFFRDGLNKPEPNRIMLFEGIAYAYEMMGDFGNAIRAYKDAAASTAMDHEVDRMLKGVKRCRRKRVALFFSF